MYILSFEGPGLSPPDRLGLFCRFYRILSWKSTLHTGDIYLRWWSWGLGAHDLNIQEKCGWSMWLSASSNCHVSAAEELQVWYLSTKARSQTKTERVPMLEDLHRQVFSIIYKECYSSILKIWRFWIFQTKMIQGDRRGAVFLH